MRTNIVIDDTLMAEAMLRSGGRSKRAVVEEALHTLIRLKRQESVLDHFGAFRWEGDLDAMRRDD